MNQEQKRPDRYGDSLSCHGPGRLSFREAIAKAEEQIEIEAIDSFKAEARELCMIMAEVWMMDPKGSIKVSGEVLETYLVQQVFEEITCEHVKLVLEKFHGINYLVQNKKAYLRAALYNSVFELGAHYSNLVSQNSF
ncbi:MAG: hypothetical protein J6S14_12815 [Clostridia bacterium]|nr:hypothetical protein [Clostridia bacterium]